MVTLSVNLSNISPAVAKNGLWGSNGQPQLACIHVRWHVCMNPWCNDLDGETVILSHLSGMPQPTICHTLTQNTRGVVDALNRHLGAFVTRSRNPNRNQTVH